MSEKTLNDLNVMNEETLVSPTELKDLIPASEGAFQTVREGRDTIKKILDREDPRLFLVVGPCSIHDPTEALDGTIRKEFALSKGENSVHGSDAPETAAEEIAYFFAGNEILR